MRMACGLDLDRSNASTLGTYLILLLFNVGGTNAHRSREPKYKIEFHSEDFPYLPVRT